MKNDSLITVFTPTYNRAYIISNLYESLKRQTYRNFEWLIVDDGSTDTTEDLIRSFIDENRITIFYFKQTNGGKHTAINKGVTEAKGNLFFIVDSDDYLANDSLEKIKQYGHEIGNDSEFAGIYGLRAHFDGRVIGNQIERSTLSCTLFEYRYKYGYRGDNAEVYKTNILKQYPFPKIFNENFIAESIVWNRIARDNYKLLFFPEKIYFTKYLNDGLTRNSVKGRMKNPIGATLLYQELSKSNIPLIFKLKSVINYWRFRFCIKIKQSNISQNVNWGLSIFALPIALIMHMKDVKKWKNK